MSLSLVSEHDRHGITLMCEKASNRDKTVQSSSRRRYIAKVQSTLQGHYIVLHCKDSAAAKGADSRRMSGVVHAWSTQSALRPTERNRAHMSASSAGLRPSPATRERELQAREALLVQRLQEVSHRVGDPSTRSPFARSGRFGCSFQNRGILHYTVSK